MFPSGHRGQNFNGIGKSTCGITKKNMFHTIKAKWSYMNNQICEINLMKMKDWDKVYKREENN